MSKRKKREARGQSRGPRIPRLSPMTAKQSRYINTIYEGPVTVCTGYAGTGKTYVAATLAATMYLEGHIENIILTRPNVSSGRGLGFFPGTVEEKMDPWMQPLISRIKAVLGQGQYEHAVRKGHFKVEPFETMRGASYSGFVILDEAQNITPDEMKMFLTRYEDGRVIINGDILQSDLKVKSGLSVITEMIHRGDLPFHHVDFSDVEDIVRSDVCKDVILAWNRYEKGKVQ